MVKERFLIKFRERRNTELELSFVEYEIMDLTSEFPGKFCRIFLTYRREGCSLFSKLFIFLCGVFL
jgi:hypothetical protein